MENDGLQPTITPAAHTIPLPAPLNLIGRRVVVTGAASGIGRATASALAKLGATVLLSDISSLEATSSDLAKLGVVPEIVEGDLLQSGAVDKLFGRGAVYALAHCAGIVPPIPWDQDPDWETRFARTMSVNVRLPIEIGHAAVDHMKANGDGRIVLIGSLAGWTGGTLTTTPPDYVTSKGGLHALIRLLARKAASGGVLVNGVAPGPVETPFADGFNFPVEAFPLGRMARPEEIAWPIAFLCTPAASNFLGEIVNVNGGVHLL